MNRYHDPLLRMALRLGRHQRDNAAHEIHIAPLQLCAIAKTLPRIDAECKENAHFPFRLVADLNQLFDRQFAARLRNRILLLDVLPRQPAPFSNAARIPPRGCEKRVEYSWYAEAEVVASATAAKR